MWKKKAKRDADKKKPPSSDDEEGDVTEEGKEDEENSPSCAVCMTEFVEGDVVNTLPCGHEFHKECVAKWLPIKKVCPLCRHDITRKGAVAPLAKEKNSRNTQLEA